MQASTVRKGLTREWGRSSFPTHAVDLFMAAWHGKSFPVRLLLSLFTFVLYLHLIVSSSGSCIYLDKQTGLCDSPLGLVFCLPVLPVFVQMRGGNADSVKGQDVSSKTTKPMEWLSVISSDVVHFGPRVGHYQNMHLMDRIQQTGSDSNNLDSSCWSGPMGYQVIAFSQCTQLVYNHQRPNSMELSQHSLN